jgi:predicted MPP superfamily phosphohydrolase
VLGSVSAVAAAAAAAGAAWGLVEAAWVRLRELEIALERLPRELDGIRVAHLSDFHLGAPSPSIRAVERAVDWVAARAPDLVLISGDLLTHPRGERKLRELIARIPAAHAVLGNHDFGDARDPLASPSRLEEIEPARLLRDDAATVNVRGRRVQIVGVDPRTYKRGVARPHERADDTADLRILLCHYPLVFDRLPRGAFDLVLTGHLHDGQIAIPYGFGKLRLAHFNWRYTRGVYRRDGSVMHVSPGLGTTFVPFRFGARPEATELTLRSGSWPHTSKA